MLEVRGRKEPTSSAFADEDDDDSHNEKSLN
jgi:hypothetical protein